MDWRKELERICADRKSGAFMLAKKAVRLLISMGRNGVAPSKLIEAAEQIANAHPAMAPLWHLNRLTKEACEHQPEKLSAVLNRFLADMETHTEAAISNAAEWLPEGRIVTHSFSSLVFQALVHAHRKGKRVEAVCTASFPGGEGISLARSLAKANVPVTLVADFQAFRWMSQCRLVLVGADAWCEDGLVHKVGTKFLALAAKQMGVPFWSVGTSEKKLPARWHEKMKGEAPLLARLSVPQDRTLYDLTEWSFVTGTIDELGVHQVQHY